MMRLRAEVDEAAAAVRFTATPMGEVPAPMEVEVDGLRIAQVPPADARPHALALPFEALRAITAGRVVLRLGGQPAPEGALHTEGEFFEALSLPDPARFHEKVQLNHSRYASRLLLELGARAAHERFAQDPVTRAAALTILGHRHIERLAAPRSPAEEARIGWLLARAAPLAEEALARLAPGATATARPDWQDVRWNVSLATVAGYLHLARGEVAAARGMFALPRSTLHLVGLSKVSALNMIVGCFLHGVLSHMQGDARAARDSLEAGIEGVKPVVQAQNLLANVWVTGDLVNVMRVARQCYIARARLGLAPAAGPEPLLDAGSVLTLQEITGPLPALSRGGLVPALQAHILRHGGR